MLRHFISGKAGAKEHLLVPETRRDFFLCLEGIRREKQRKSHSHLSLSVISSFTNFLGTLATRNVLIVRINHKWGVVDSLNTVLLVKLAIQLQFLRWK